MRDPRKNVLFVAVDDLRPQLGCYGVEWIQSPNIDAFAAQGLLLERAYCQQAICAPSRASVLTGCRPDTTTIYDLCTPVREAMPDVLTLPQHFKQQGYETVSIGKIYHHAKDDREGWSQPPFQSAGDWKGRGYLTDEALEQIKINAEAMIARGEAFKAGQVGPAYECADVPDDAYHDGKDAVAAIAKLKALAQLEKPFFLALGFHKPHLPFSAPKRYWDMYDPTTIPLAPNRFEPDGVTPYSLTNYGELRSYFGIPDDGPIPEDQERKLIQGYAACVSYMDAQFGRVMAELDGLGLRENTIVMLWGDHGWKLGEHASWSKHTNFEIDAQAPLIVSSPDMKAAGSTTTQLVEFVDMYPTLCELADIPVPEHCEGSSFAPLLDAPATPWKQAVFHQYPRGGGVMGYAVRTDRYRYVEWANRDENNTLLARELYDHRTDGHENRNIVDDHDRRSVGAELSEILHNGWQAQRP